MKTDRLIGIIMYLLNHEKATASELAGRFEVSARTIARDMDALGMAGIPIVSAYGSNGGYSILDTYQLDKTLLDAQDYLNIICSLQGMRSATGCQKTEGTLEKLMALKGVAPKSTASKNTASGRTAKAMPAGNTASRVLPEEQKIFLDFSVCREGEYTESYLRLLEKAIADRSVVRFEYTAADGACHLREAEPLALSFRWYAWYLFAYCRRKRDYRFFKLPRIRELEILEEVSAASHPDVNRLMEEHLGHDSRKVLSITLKCCPFVRTAVCEYLNGRITEEYPDGSFLFHFCVPEGERMWFSLLLGFGNQVQVLEPPEVRERLIRQSREILSLYCPGD